MINVLLKNPKNWWNTYKMKKELINMKSNIGFPNVRILEKTFN